VDPAGSFTLGSRVVVPIRDKEKTYHPPLDKGDREFSGNDPRVTVRVHFFAEETAVYRSIYMFADEVGGSNLFWDVAKKTLARGFSPEKPVYEAPRGKRIKELPGIPAFFTLVDERIRGHLPRVFENTVVGKVVVYGDRHGKDVGNYTGVSIDFDYDLPVVLEDVKGAPQVRVPFPSYFSFKPPHTKGDRDFDGHGPLVRIHANLHHSEDFAGLMLQMKASEGGVAIGGTGSNYLDTVAEGSEFRILFRAPPGWRITGTQGQRKNASVPGKTQFYDVVNYLDNDHESDGFDTPIGQFRVWGDGPGDDAGLRTRLELRSNKSFTVEMEPVGGKTDALSTGPSRRRSR
jgi:hypothetical protein